MDGALPRWFRGEPGRVGQIALNLLGNAVKFTDVGHVTLRARATSGGVCIEVEDTGIGISEEVQARLFAPFEQAERSTHRKFGGTGLGLAISRRLTELMGGTLDVRSLQGSAAPSSSRCPSRPPKRRATSRGPSTCPRSRSRHRCSSWTTTPSTT